jgi:hypothetical protein
VGNPQVGNNDIASGVNLVMGRSRLLLILVVLVLANLVRGPSGVLASCATIPQLATALSDAPAVFVGTVTFVDHAGRVANVHVDDVWKGRVAAAVQVVGTPDLNAGQPQSTAITPSGRNTCSSPSRAAATAFRTTTAL